MKTTTKITMVFLVSLALCAAVQADELLVPAGYPTIQAAINAALNGDTVIVADGTYTGPGNRDIDFLGKTITVKSENGPNNCIIDCNGTEAEPHRGFYFHNNENHNAVVEGFTITNGYAYFGGGIYCRYGSSPTITNCTIGGNTAEYAGGGIYCYYDSSPKISNCTISGNSARDAGGGIYCRYGSSPTITNCTISDNTAERGGGIYCRYGSSPTITNCTISGNKGRREGGGIYCEYDSSPTITNCIISGNSGQYGGGILCQDNSSPTITNCTISGNNAADGDGGGISCEESSPTITNCTIGGNTAEYAGGGIYCRYGSSPTITNCTINGNSAEWYGGGIYCEGDNSSLTITNCILWANEAPDGPQIYLEGNTTNTWVRYTDVQGGQTDVYVEPGGTLNWGPGNIDLDPLFALTTDYHLMPGSPCIDVGTNTPTGSLPPTDRDGVPRPLDGDGDANAVADMGAYEYAPNSPSIAVSALSFYFVQDWPKPYPQSLQIRNCGGRPLHWEIVEDCSWLEVAPANGVSTDQINEVTITVNPNGLILGLYSCTFNVQDANASNSPVTIRVTMPVGTVLPVPSPNYPTIQAAIDAADNYDIVLVADGNYTGPGNRDIDFLGKAITVRSQSGPENCIIDCNGTEDDPHRGFYFHSGEGADSVLDGFTIINGYAEYSGGGICCYNSNPTITNCIISNTAAGQGGGIYCWRSSPTITNCNISGNSAEHDSGGICCWGGRATITNCIISGNSAEWAGGGILAYRASSIITNCTISGNSAKADESLGGGIYCYGGSVTITKCDITNNSAEGVWPSGGGICSHGSSPTITNCTISGNNAADGDGGGIFCEKSSNLTISNCTFAENLSLNGTALACDSWSQRYPSSVQLTNCILWNGGSEIWNNDGSAITITYSNIQDGYEGEGNIDADPYFVEPGYWDTNSTPDDSNDDFWVEGDYHLLPTSPCIDAGDPNYAPEPNETDIDGNPRVIGDAIDMGAYETNYIQAQMKLTPQALSCDSKGNFVKAHFILPEGFLPEDVDVNEPAWAEPMGAYSESIKVFSNNEGPVKLDIIFDREAFCETITETGEVEVTVIGFLTAGRYFYATDTIKIKPQHQRITYRYKKNQHNQRPPR